MHCHDLSQARFISDTIHRLQRVKRYVEVLPEWRRRVRIRQRVSKRWTLARDSTLAMLKIKLVTGGAIKTGAKVAPAPMEEKKSAVEGGEGQKPKGKKKGQGKKAAGKKAVAAPAATEENKSAESAAKGKKGKQAGQDIIIRNKSNCRVVGTTIIPMGEKRRVKPKKPAAKEPTAKKKTKKVQAPMDAETRRAMKLLELQQKHLARQEKFRKQHEGEPPFRKLLKGVKETMRDAIVFRDLGRSKDLELSVWLCSFQCTRADLADASAGALCSSTIHPSTDTCTRPVTHDTRTWRDRSRARHANRYVLNETYAHMLKYGANAAIPKARLKKEARAVMWPHPFADRCKSVLEEIRRRDLGEGKQEKKKKKKAAPKPPPAASGLVADQKKYGAAIQWLIDKKLKGLAEALLKDELLEPDAGWEEIVDLAADPDDLEEIPVRTNGRWTAIF